MINTCVWEMCTVEKVCVYVEAFRPEIGVSVYRLKVHLDEITMKNGIGKKYPSLRVSVLVFLLFLK